LLPYPMSKIDDLVHSGKLDEARQFLVSYCSSEFIDQKLVGTWWTVPVYRDRKEILGLWTIQG